MLLDGIVRTLYVVTMPPSDWAGRNFISYFSRPTDCCKVNKLWKNYHLPRRTRKGDINFKEYICLNLGITVLNFIVSRFVRRRRSKSNSRG